MQRRFLCWLMTIAVVAPVAAVAAEEFRTLVRLDGWIVDSYCREKNANPDGVEDTLACLKKGAKLILLASDGTTYALENQELALKHLGKEVHVFGMVDEERNLRVGNYIPDEALKGPGDPSGEPRDDGFVGRKVEPEKDEGETGKAKAKSPDTKPARPEKRDDAR